MRYVLHCDLNNFYASCECLLNPAIRDSAVVVCGRVEDRHGIVLAKNYKAKAFGIKTGEVLWEAKQKCPNLVCVEARHGIYLKFSRLVRKIYSEYTDRIEPFGIDEAWLELTGIVHSFSEAENVANKIRERVKNEIGLTISVGVSFCKVFAKLGSDMKKPDAVTLITPENFKEKVWPLPVSDLLYVGRATTKKFEDLNILTIGDLAKIDEKIIAKKFGKVGTMLIEYARGEENGEVRKYDEHAEIKSVGNSITYYKDLSSPEDIFALFLLLSESVVARMKKYGFKKARSLMVTITDNNLSSLQRMMKMTPATDLSTEIAKNAMMLFEKNFGYKTKVRGLGVSVSDFTNCEQTVLFEDIIRREKDEKFQEAVENLRNRFGRKIIQRATIMRDPRMKEINIIEDHQVTPTIFDSLSQQKQDRNKLIEKLNNQ